MEVIKWRVGLIRNEIIKLLDTNEVLRDMLQDNTRKKFNREKVNLIFKIIHDHFESDMNLREFSNLIYVFDNISNLSGLRYTNLFDLLDYEYKQKLILELDKIYNILNKTSKTNLLF